MNTLNIENKINNYKLLCSIKPHYKKSKYPYSHWTPEKIINTGKMIKLVSANKNNTKNGRPKKLVTWEKRIKHGGSGENKIWVF